MWSRLASRVSDEAIVTLLGRAQDLISKSEEDNSVSFGKDFFSGPDTEDNNLDLLRLLHQDIWPEMADLVNFDVPVVDHSILLIKGAGAPGTKLRQDRAYWVSRDPEPTIFSVWIALDNLTAEKGCLILSRDNEVDVSGMSAFNTGSILDHNEDYQQAGGFPITIPEATAKQMKESMAYIHLARGEALAFDSFEPHTTGPNTTSAPRLAMKIAYSEGKEKDRYLMRTEDLENYCGIK